MTEGLLLLLPPSETKRDGGNAAFTGELVESPEAGGLSWAKTFTETRELIASELHHLSHDQDTARKVLKISEKQAELELSRNRNLRSAPRMPALLRYTGVLYDALDAPTLTAQQLSWAAHHVAVHSALFGLVGGGEGIPAYRLSAASRLGGRPATSRWTPITRAALAAHQGLVVDLRSKAYAALGPVDAADRHVTIDVASRSPDGTVRSLNHFNKRGKGLFTRGLIALAVAEPERADALQDAADLVEFCLDAGWELESTGVGTARLIVPEGA
ncbi:peroxide stress protein YaaA [Pseudoclavibacter sp. AY1F1]|uniref:YaaA family protein n=1 Tax=Pseudoclavibacter sp. AY1F1 TaxID=2080583 RepID=UPI000CE91D10|nr:peroxide stress protein YaaA [Pseudoclavibacter sp. AY1F1]PPF47118.1 peroxide stress protein YaaA [Pseudoclavibacter sp. AY1F1]